MIVVAVVVIVGMTRRVEHAVTTQPSASRRQRCRRFDPHDPAADGPPSRPAAARHRSRAADPDDELEPRGRDPAGPTTAPSADAAPPRAAAPSAEPSETDAGRRDPSRAGAAPAEPRTRAAPAAERAARPRPSPSPMASRRAAEPEAARRARAGRAQRPSRSSVADDPPRRRRPDGVHRPRRELPRPARGARRGGIRVVATRHEGGAAFMAEAYGQLTGRPGRVPRDARGRRGEPRDRHPHRAPELDPDVRDRRPGRRGVPRPRGVPGGRPGRDVRPPRQVGAELATAADGRRRARGDAVRARARRPARAGAARRSPRTCSTRRSPRHAPPPVRPRTAAARTSATSGAVLQLLASAERPVILAGAGVLRARTLERPRPARRAAPGPGDRRLAPRRRLPERSPAVPRDGRLRRAARRPRAAQRGGRAARHRLPAERDRRRSSYTVPRAGPAWAHVDLEPRSDRPASRRPTSRSAPTPGRSCGAPSQRLEAGRARCRAASHARQAANATDRAAWEAGATVDDGGVGRARASIPGRDRRGRSGGCSPTRRSSRPTPATSAAGRRAASGSAGPGTFLGPTSGAMGYGAARPRSPRRSSTAIGPSSRSPATAAWR